MTTNSPLRQACLLFDMISCFEILSSLGLWCKKDQKKHQDQQHTEQEAIFGSRPSPARPVSVGNKKVIGPRTNGGGANGTPNRRLSLNPHQNGSRSIVKDGKRDNNRPVAPLNYVAISKDDAASHVSGGDPVPASP